MTRWYAEYFTADYWSFARHEYTAARTAGEVAYLVKTLEEHAPGRRVLDLGCGIGRHAVALAEHGFEVVGVDVGRWALDRAEESARRAGVPLTVVLADLFGRADLPEADAAVCLQNFGWGTDDEQRRFLRRVRERLVPGGVLVLDHSNVTGILTRYQPTARFEAEGTVFDFFRSYDPVTGRNQGELRVTHPDGTVARLLDDVRLYQPPEVAAMLRDAGYEIVRVDADFAAGSEVRIDTRYVQFVARAAARPEPAVLDYTRVTPAPGDLDLRWAPDEIEFVRDVIDEVWAEVAPHGRPTPAAGDIPDHRPDSAPADHSYHRPNSAPAEHPDHRPASVLADLARHLAVTDPYGGVRAAPVLSAHFGADITPERVIAGAGTTTLLHALGALAAPGTLLCTPYSHPDLPGWAARLGATLRPFDPAADDAPETIARLRPALVLVERPGVLGELLPPDRVRALAEAARDVGGLLVLDEACATYAGPEASAVPLTSEAEGLVVLRGLSKGYCCGGLRIGFAICSAGTGATLRRAAPPLAASALPLEVALRLLERGDVLQPLRTALATAKPELVAGLRRLGLTVAPGHPTLPWVTVEGHVPPGLLGKPVRPIFGAPRTRISVPLSAARRDAFRALVERADAAGG
ncbi:aminotransferase class I/II-fold pyridoxal phosphate-dependent enzyme [Sphaerisporangium album]|uniref:Aminotransferase class I/II-fold pyridoxal phosphate-dependent enzyme n=1 Tax=Sphaerisporangium album TaxID=509200 RepID=A0A367FNZ7_9ACTN|nr:aminotransferase class I/II-fold pyridoxal phosphate-dependent enzyme [Sphaerisporangium album]RCG32108.1 aminotransferase class I/II-fold pyridoxal phosphate-dependent enzyme [Sphaerisporangium album]